MPSNWVLISATRLGIAGCSRLCLLPGTCTQVQIGEVEVTNR